MNRPAHDELRASDDRWFDGPLGRHLLDAERRAMDAALAQVFGFLLVQVGRWGAAGTLLGASRVQRTVQVDPAPADGGALRCDPAQLPFASSSVDAVVLPHILERVAQPHAVIREAERVLVGEGHLIVLGFHPWSCWGLRRTFAHRRFPSDAPVCISENRLRDWLALLDFEVTGATRVLHGLPIDHAGVLARSAWLERVGARAWPQLGAAYVMTARKRVLGVTPLRAIRAAAAPLGSFAEPVVRSVEAA